MTGEDFTKGEFQGKVLEKLENIESWLMSIEKKKVNRDEFMPVKSLAYGFASLMLIAVVSALLAVVIKAAELFFK